MENYEGIMRIIILAILGLGLLLSSCVEQKIKATSFDSPYFSKLFREQSEDEPLPQMKTHSRW